MNEKPTQPSEELLRLKALALVQAADISSLLQIVQLLAASLRKMQPDLVDLDALFVDQRKKTVQAWLEGYETTNPALAARLQQLLDQSCTHLPFGYD